MVKIKKLSVVKGLELTKQAMGLVLGGGDGTYNSPWDISSYDEIDQAGYYRLDGNVFYSSTPAEVVASSNNSSSSYYYDDPCVCEPDNTRVDPGIILP